MLYFSLFFSINRDIESVLFICPGRIEFYFSMTMDKFEEVWSYDFMSFIGELGGTLGMLLGVSVLSIFELIETMLLKDEDAI